jgi:D-tyrosyl-tRNA(Tyr) deacylase
VKIVLQRVRSASVTVDGEKISEIGMGLLLLVGVAHGDGAAEADWLANKISGLRVMADSQFTLLGDTRKGRRPSFVEAAPPDVAGPLFDHFCEELSGAGVRVQKGRFGAVMDVGLVNDGPVTILLERRPG